MGKPNNNQRRSRRYDPQPGRFCPDDRDLRTYDNQDIPDDTVSLPEREIQNPSAPLGSNQSRDANETPSTFSRPVDSADNSLDSQPEPHVYSRIYPNPHVEEKGERSKKSSSKEPPSNDDPHPRPKSPEEILLDDIDTTEKKGRLIREQLNINAQMQENLQAEAANYEDERNVMKVRENLLQQQEDNLDQVKEFRERLARLQAGEEAAMKNHVTIFEAIRDIKKMIKESNSNTCNVLERVEKLEKKKLNESEFFSPVSDFGSDYRSTPQPPGSEPSPRQKGRRGRRGSSPSSSSSSSSSASSRSSRTQHSHDRRNKSADRRSDKSRGSKSSGRSRGGQRPRDTRDHGHRNPGDPRGPGGGGPGYDPMRGGQRRADKRKKKHSHTSGGGSGGDPGPGGGGGDGPPSGDGFSSSSSDSDSDLSRRSHFNQDPVSRLIYKLKMIIRKMKRALRNHPNVKILLEQEIQRGNKISLELDDHVARLRHVTTSDLDRIERLGERVDRARVRLTIQVEQLELE